MLDWTYLAVPGLLVSLAALSLGVFVWRLDAGRVQNRRAAMLLLALGLLVLAQGAFRPLAEDPEDAFAAALVAMVIATFGPILLVRFMATFQTPLVVPLRVPALRALIWVATVGSIVLWLVAPRSVVETAVRVPAAGVWSVPAGPGAAIVLGAVFVIATFGAVAALMAAHRAESATRHEQGRAYFLALGTAALGAVGALVWPLIMGDATTATARSVWASYVLAATLAFSVALLVMRGVLKDQVFDVRVKARGLVKQSTVVGVFTFVVISAGEILERVIPLPGVVIGIAAAVALGLVFRPLQAAAGRLAERLVPDPLGAAGFRYSNHQVYRSAIAGAFGDGEISAKELKTLRTLRTQLGLDDAVAEEIERDVRHQMRGRP